MTYIIIVKKFPNITFSVVGGGLCIDAWLDLVVYLGIPGWILLLSQLTCLLVYLSDRPAAVSMLEDFVSVSRVRMESMDR